MNINNKSCEFDAILCRKKFYSKLIAKWFKLYLIKLKYIKEYNVN